MSGKKLVLIIEASQGYLPQAEDREGFQFQNSQIFSAITETYIPLLNMFARLEKENIQFKLGLAVSPSICALLSDPHIQDLYVEYLDALIELGKSEISRCSTMDCREQAQKCLERIEKTKADFVDLYGKNILAQIRRYEKLGFLELIPTAATSAYLPHYSDFTEAINAQVETGLYSQRNFFGSTGDGFWLPFMGWDKALEIPLRSYGINYTVLDARSILFSEQCPDEGIFHPVRTKRSLVIFGNDPDTFQQIAGEEGFCQNEVYRSQTRDIGFELPQESLGGYFGGSGARIPTGYKYWSNESEDGDTVPYNEQKAELQIIEDAFSFYSSKAEKLSQASECMGEKDAVLVCTIPAEFLGQKWHEGVAWLENVIRCQASKRGFEFDLCRNLLKNQFSLKKIEPYQCSANGLGYGEDLLDNSNSWMLRYTRKATQRIIDLAERFPSESSLKERLLNMAAKQVLLAQSGNWPAMIHDGQMLDYVESLFKDEILSFTKVFASLASNTVSTEWLTSCERKNPLFPWLNYRIFSRKK
ncbi:1,4-alpha-glucan branching protein domain-containing protein [Treponema sp.]|uniref:1,4-alpha-glucan branching protein domain-containing protein n=1 Tax=Treponema sp. TaxID=166 RepID=UPI003F09A191